MQAPCIFRRSPHRLLLIQTSSHKPSRASQASGTRRSITAEPRMNAEVRAGVMHVPFRAFHGFRRMVVGEVGAQMKDPTAGLEYIGDRDPKLFKHYDRRRPERINRGSAAMERVREVPGYTNAAPSGSGDVKAGR